MFLQLLDYLNFLLFWVNLVNIQVILENYLMKCMYQEVLNRLKYLLKIVFKLFYLLINDMFILNIDLSGYGDNVV